MERPSGHLLIGEQINAESGDRTGEAVLLDSGDLTTHGVIVGMTGSGKTGMGVVVLEEALMAGIPVLAIDPKGDLGNLCLTFPDLSAAQFEPWMDAGAARVDNVDIGQLAEKTAEQWRSGLESWGMDGSDVATLAHAADPVIYTPGSTAGVPLDVLGRLQPPVATDPAARQDEIDSTVGGLLGLIGVDSDPLSGREHILLANLIARAWDAGTPLDMPTLLAQIMEPPIRKLGVLELDTFFPAKDRQALVLKLNGLLASPSFAAWAEGAPLDIERMLWDSTGKARAAVVSLNHLEETERQFAITLILSKLISWMRSQSGTGELRALVYIDEVMGLAPPVGNPPPKKPILTLLKQARAFGVGLVLSTQNPVDLDYKAISNAGTWLIGRLQTEQDKDRLVDGLKTADGSADIKKLEATISSLGKRQFLLRSTKSSTMPVLSSRWALSYLAGPLTRDQISTLMADKKSTEIGNRTPSASESMPVSTVEAAPTAAPAPAGATEEPPSPADDKDAVSARESQSAAGSAASVAGATDLADDESVMAPTFPDSLAVRYVTPAAPWLAELDWGSPGDRLQAAMAARVSLLFDERKADLRHSEEWEAIIPVTGDQIDVGQAIAVDFDDRDFTGEAPTRPIYILPSMDIGASDVRSLGTDLKNHLAAGETLELFTNPELKLYSRPGESRDEFEARCRAAADDEMDAEAAKIRERLERKQESIEAALAKAEDRVNELEVQAEGRRNSQLIDIGTSVLGGLLGGRSRTRGLASAARRMSSSSRQKASTEARLDTARNRVAEKVEDLDELEMQLADAILDIETEWLEKSRLVETFQVPLEKTDINVSDVMLIWIPVSRS